MSCPSAAFCAAVDDSGHALRWNGLGWSAGSRIDDSALTSVSCADAAFCVAVDARGEAVRGNGARWLAPTRVDAAGFTGVSRAASARASARASAAVDFAGNGVVLCPAGRAGATVRAQASDDGRLVSRRSLAE